MKLLIKISSLLKLKVQIFMTLNFLWITSSCDCGESISGKDDGEIEIKGDSIDNFIEIAESKDEEFIDEDVQYIDSTEQ